MMEKENGIYCIAFRVLGFWVLGLGFFGFWA